MTLCISPNFRCQPRIAKHFFCMARSSHKQAPLQPSSPSSPLSFHSLGTKRVSFGKANQSSRDTIAQLLDGAQTPSAKQDITSKCSSLGKCTSSDVLPTVDFQTMDKNQSKLIVRPNQEIMAKRGCPGDKLMLGYKIFAQ